ncbi:MAG: acyl-CoA dehydrogenase family protein [Acidimicrobiales bacterium]
MVQSDTDRVDTLIDELLADHPPKDTDGTKFLGEQFDRGLAWVHFPEGEGGLGLSPALHARVTTRLMTAGAPSAAMRNVIGYGMVAPTIVTHGTEDQKQKYLRPLFTGEQVWCQLFSEPGSGSDVAGLATRAVRDGDEWVVNGQKVWTTVAHLAHRGLLLARTNADVPKHQGITCFLIDMHGEGVDVRPLHQITGEAEFNEVFFTDAKVPDSDRLGGEGEGWRTAITTLMNERVSIGGGVSRRGTGPIDVAIKVWKERWAGDTSAHALALRDRLMQLWVMSEATRLTNQRASDLRRRGTPGPEGSVGKLAFAEQNKMITEFSVDLMGSEGMLHSNDYPKIRPSGVGMGGFDVHRQFLRTRANSIEGGTSEVMRNILGERVLGLPGDVRSDKEIAWKDVPRS